MRNLFDRRGKRPPAQSQIETIGESEQNISHGKGEEEQIRRMGNGVVETRHEQREQCKASERIAGAQDE